MDRRTFLASTAAVIAAGPALAFRNYGPGIVEKELKAGKTVFVDFAADWCSTCRAQEAKIRKLRKENPAYDANVTFIRVDWDKYGNSKLANRLNIPRRSTLVVLKGDQELGRIVAGTRENEIKALLDTALAAAVA
ncbi:MAG: thioredoxin family protein [Paracoccaceae bacterium]|nr:thioredoxin family protein [Paracoccaceae bacterium]